MKYPDLVIDELNYTAIAISRYSLLPAELRQMLHEAGRREDIIAWLFVSAMESYVCKRDFRNARNAANRALYWALKAEGFHRDMSENQQYRLREIPQSAISNFSMEEVNDGE